MRAIRQRNGSIRRNANFLRATGRKSLVPRTRPFDLYRNSICAETTGLLARGACVDSLLKKWTLTVQNDTKRKTTHVGQMGRRGLQLAQGPEKHSALPGLSQSAGGLGRFVHRWLLVALDPVE